MQDLISQIEPMIPALRRYARALLRSAELADDLVQDCLERVVERWSQRQRAEDTRQWVFAILHNLAIDSMRQQARRGVHLTIDDVAESEMAVPGRQEDGLHRQDLLRALESLPPDQRSVILLVSVEDLSYVETARMLDIPLGTVMSRLSRGRERLHKIMDGGSATPTRTTGAPALRRLK